MTYGPERGWLDALVTTSTAGTIQDLDYTRDPLGRITAVASPEPGESWIYGYDDLDRLISADNTSDNSLDQTFTYDLVGNMLTNSAVGAYSYPAPGSARPHAVTGIAGGPLGSQSFAYDANGSMTVQGPDTRVYDGENRLVGATDGATATAFVYGPDGARLKKTANGATTLYFGDDLEVVPGAAPQYTKYLPGDAKRVGLGGGAVTTWLHRDHLRSVRAITDAAGAIVDRANYRPFGEQLGFATADESKGYIGERHDAETGLLYLHARYYDPVLARFVQADPMDPTVPGVGVNRYSYVFNNPVMMLDPSGLKSGDNDHYGGNAYGTEHGQNNNGGGSSGSAGGNGRGFSYCPNCAHQGIGMMLNGERVFFAGTELAVASLYGTGAFNPAWEAAAKPIAEAVREVLRRAAAQGRLSPTQLAAADDRRPVIPRRHLTPGEIELAKLYAPGVGLPNDFWSGVNVIPNEQFSVSRVSPNTLHIARSLASIADFSAPGIAKEDVAVFVHELTHLWQDGTWGSGTFISRGLKEAGVNYHYALSSSSSFSSFNMEQQGAIAQDNYLTSHGIRPEYAINSPTRRDYDNVLHSFGIHPSWGQ